MKPMTGKTVLITGGIGKAAPVGLALMGARVGITGRTGTPSGEDGRKAGITRVAMLFAVVSGFIGIALAPPPPGRGDRLPVDRALP